MMITFGITMEKGQSVSHLPDDIASYDTVSWSVVSISDLGSIFTSALSTLVNVVCRLVYIEYRPPNHILCYITKSTLDITYRA